MDIASVQNNIGMSHMTELKDKSITNNQLFEEFYNAAIELISTTDNTILAYEDMQLQVATGETDDILGLTLLQSKASTSLQFLVSLTNKTVEAYKEIMRMQV